MARVNKAVARVLEVRLMPRDVTQGIALHIIDHMTYKPDRACTSTLSFHEHRLVSKSRLYM